MLARASRGIAELARFGPELKAETGLSDATKINIDGDKPLEEVAAYFADPQDMIPDSIPVLGFIDDAIMIELLTAELRPEIDAYNDFCRYRKEAKSLKGKNVSFRNMSFSGDMVNQRPRSKGFTNDEEYLQHVG